VSGFSSGHGVWTGAFSPFKTAASSTMLRNLVKP
jgi:hypothetical protein